MGKVIKNVNMTSKDILGACLGYKYKYVGPPKYKLNIIINDKCIRSKICLFLNKKIKMVRELRSYHMAHTDTETYIHTQMAFMVFISSNYSIF